MEILIPSSLIKTSRTEIGLFNDSNFFITFLFIVIIAPIYEEFIFRGVFSTKNIVTIAASILLPLIVAGTLYFNYNNWIFYIGTILALGTSFANYWVKNIKIIKVGVYIVFALLFALIHWSNQDFNSLTNLYLLLPHFSLSLVLSWITLNFSLLKSILSHLLYNCVLFAFGTIGLFFFDNKLHKTEFNNSILEWQKTSFFSSESTLKTNLNGYTFEETTLIDINKLILSNKLNKYHFKTNPFQSFNMNFKVMTDSLSYEGMQQTFIDCLEKAEIIRK